MLFRPTIEANLTAVQSMLDGWNEDADRYRRAAIAMRRGGEVDGLVANAAAEAHEGVERVLEEIEGALDRLPAGDRRMSELLQILVSAQALAESLERSCEVLSVATETRGPAHIPHDYANAAQ